MSLISVPKINDRINLTTASLGTDAPFLSLPLEITKCIFSFLPSKSYGKFFQVCKIFSVISDDKMLWEKLFLYNFPSYKIRENFSIKDQYKNRFLTEKNWTSGTHRTTEIFINSHYAVTAFSVFPDVIVSKAADSRIVIINKDTLKQTLSDQKWMDDYQFYDAGEYFISQENEGPTGPIRFKVWEKSTGKKSCTIDEGFDCLIDGDVIVINRIKNRHPITFTLDVFDKKTGSLIDTLDPNQGTRFILQDETYYFGKMKDGTVKSWLKSDRTLFKTFVFQDDPVFSVISFENHIITSHNSGAIRFSDKNSGQLIHTLSCDPARDCHFLQKEEDFLIGVTDDSLLICDLKTKTFLFQVPNVSSTCVVAESVLYAASSQSDRIDVVDMKNGHVQFSLEGAKGKIFKITISHGRLFVLKRNSDYKILEIWDLKTKKLIKTFSDIGAFHVEKDHIYGTIKGNVVIWDFLA